MHYLSDDDKKVEVLGPIFDVSKTIDRYFLGKENFSFNSLNFFGGKILLNNNFMLNPVSGVKIFRYNTISKNDMEKYNKCLDNIVESILSDARI